MIFLKSGKRAPRGVNIGPKQTFRKSTVCSRNDCLRVNQCSLAAHYQCYSLRHVSIVIDSAQSVTFSVLGTI